MFSDDFRSGATIKSTWKHSRKQRESSSQTSEIITYEIQSQTVSPKDAECQTVDLTKLLQASMTSNDAKYDESSLAKFMAGVEPMVTRQLKRNAALNVFEELGWGTDVESSDVSITCEYCLQESSVKKEARKDEKRMEVTSLSWSSTGGSIAVAYGSMKHMAWGQTKSYLCVWNIDRSQVHLHKADHKLELESSIQTVSFHPTQTALLAAGLFSGIVLIWDLTKDEAVYSKESHEDPVTSVCWLEPRSRKFLNLLSASTDGKLIVWEHKLSKISQDEKHLNPIKSFRIRAGTIRSSGAKGIGSVGITCCAVAITVKDGIEFTTGDERVLVAGCENGAIVKCDVDEQSTDDDPVKFLYKGHLGPVYSIDWSPFHRHVFLTCSTDQRCRFYHALHASPLREFTPYTGVDQYLYSSRWSPAKAMTIFSGGGSGILTAYNAKDKYVINSADSEANNGKKCRINCIEVNKTRSQYIATGNADGIIHVWSLGTKYTSEDQDAMNALKEIVEKAMIED